MIKTPSGEDVLFRRMAVLMWERDVFTRAATLLVQRERGEIGISLLDGVVPDRADGFRMFSRGPTEAIPDMGWATKLLHQLRYDEVFCLFLFANLIHLFFAAKEVTDKWARFIDGTDDFELSAAEAIVASERIAAKANEKKNGWGVLI